MKTLSEAWDWYLSAKRSLERWQRLGRKHWGGLPWEHTSLGRDDEFKALEGKCQYIPNTCVPVHPERWRATVSENDLP